MGNTEGVEFAVQTGGLALAIGTEALGIATPFSEILEAVHKENPHTGIAVLPTRGVDRLFADNPELNVVETGPSWLEENLYTTSNGVPDFIRLNWASNPLGHAFIQLARGEGGVLKRLTHYGMFPNLSVTGSVAELIMRSNCNSGLIFTAHSTDLLTKYSALANRILGEGHNVKFALEVKGPMNMLGMFLYGQESLPVVLDTRHTTLVSTTSVSCPASPTSKAYSLTKGHTVAAIHLQETVRALKMIKDEGELLAALNGQNTEMTRRLKKFWDIALSANEGQPPLVVLEHSFPFYTQLDDPRSVAELILRTNEYINDLTRLEGTV